MSGTPETTVPVFKSRRGAEAVPPPPPPAPSKAFGEVPPSGKPTYPFGRPLPAWFWVFVILYIAGCLLALWSKVLA